MKAALAKLEVRQLLTAPYFYYTAATTTWSTSSSSSSSRRKNTKNKKNSNDNNIRSNTSLGEGYFEGSLRGSIQVSTRVL